MQFCSVIFRTERVRKDKASATETVNLSLILGWVKPYTLTKLIVTASIRNIYHENGQCEDSVVDWRAVDSLTRKGPFAV